MSESRIQHSSGTPPKSGSVLPSHRVLVAASIVIVSLLIPWYDTRLKTSPLAGYSPEDLAWSVTVDNFGLTWSEFSSSEVYADVAAESGDFLQAPTRYLREITGLRFTPARWNLWFGRTFFAAKRGNAAGVCLRPGILFRVATLVRGRSQQSARRDDLYSIGGLTYAWKDGFVIISRSPDFVIQALETETHRNRVGDTSIQFQGKIADGAEWLLKCRLSDDVPFSGWIEADFKARGRPLVVAAEWDEPPILAVFGVQLRDVLDLAARFGYADEEIEVFSEFIERSLPANEDQYQLVLVGFDASEVLMVPETLLFLTASRDSAFDGKYAETIPYEWNGFPGWVHPVAGEKMSLAVMRSSMGYYIATQETLMARFAGVLENSRREEGDLAISLDWEKAATAIRDLLRRAADYELIPRMGAADVEQSLLPFVAAASRLGTLELVAESRDGLLEFRGTAAARTTSGELSEAGRGGLQ